MTATPGWDGPTAAPERRRVLRFTATERLLHAVHAFAFAAMAATGIALYLPALAGRVASREALKAAHLSVASAWLVAVVLVIALGDRGRLRATLRELDLFDEDDRRWLRRRTAPQGRFNAGQKLHSVVQAAFALLFLLSGALLWYGEQDTRFRLGGTVVLHDVLTVASLVLVFGHVHLAVIHPSTRPALTGMITGHVDQLWARTHHRKWRTGFAPAPSWETRLRRPLTWALLGVAVVLAVGAFVLLRHTGADAPDASRAAEFGAS